MEKVPGKKRKTVLFHKKLVKEAGLDYTKIGAMTRDRKEWKKKVNKRISYLYKYDKKKGKKDLSEPISRNKIVRQELVHKCDICNKICKSKGGLTVHIKWMHEISSQKVNFTCDSCQEVFQHETNLVNYKKICQGTSTGSRDTRKCSLCHKTVSSSNFKHEHVGLGTDRSLILCKKGLPECMCQKLDPVDTVTKFSL